MCFGARGPYALGPRGPGPVCFGARGPCALGPGARQPDGLYGASAALQAPCLLQHLHLRHCTSDIALHLRHGPTALHLRHCSSKSLQSAWNPATIPQAIPRSHSTTVRQRHSKSIYIYRGPARSARTRLDEFFYYFNRFLLFLGSFFLCCGVLLLLLWGRFYYFGALFLFLGSFLLFWAVFIGFHVF